MAYSFVLSFTLERLHIHRTVLAKGRLSLADILLVSPLDISCEIASNLARVRPQLLKQLVSLHQVDEALEALALLIDLLVLTALQQLFLDFLEQLVLLGHQGVLLLQLIVVFTFLPLIILLDKELVY